MDPRSAVEQALRDAGFRVVPADSPLRPTYIGTSPELGILAVEVVHG